MKNTEPIFIKQQIKLEKKKNKKYQREQKILSLSDDEVKNLGKMMNSHHEGV